MIEDLTGNFSVPFSTPHFQARRYTITPKMTDERRSEFCIVFTMSLCTLESKRMFINSLFKSNCFDIKYTGSEKLLDVKL